jgi:hypothetical protein
MNVYRDNGSGCLVCCSLFSVDPEGEEFVPCAVYQCRLTHLEQEQRKEMLCLSIALRNNNKPSGTFELQTNLYSVLPLQCVAKYVFFSLLKSWIIQNFITIKTSWNTND